MPDRALNRICYVEDDEDICVQMKWALASDYEVLMAGDRTGAATTFAASHPAVTLLDLGLPRISGFEVLKRLRARKSEIPVLILTARGTLDDRVKGLDLGADDYLVLLFASRSGGEPDRAFLLDHVSALAKQRHDATECSVLVQRAL